MPNVFSCDPGWLNQMKKEHETVIIAVYSGMDKGSFPFLEKLAEIENSSTPVFIVDKDSCPLIAQMIGANFAGEAIVLKGGEEKGRVMPSDNTEEDLAKLKELLL